jgi:hypothetical protein
MQPPYFLNNNAMQSLMLQQVALQQQVIELQAATHRNAETTH